MPVEIYNAASHRAVETLAAKLRRRSAKHCMLQIPCSPRATIRQVVGSRQAALETALVLRQVISKERFHNLGQLVDIIRHVGKKLVEAQPKGLTIAHFCMYDILLLKIIFLFSVFLLPCHRAQSTLLGTRSASSFTTSEKSTTTPQKIPRLRPQTYSPSLNSCYRASRENRSQMRRRSRHWC